jgi:hypothetical protein
MTLKPHFHDILGGATWLQRARVACEVDAPRGWLKVFDGSEREGHLGRLKEVLMYRLCGALATVLLLSACTDGGESTGEAGTPDPTQSTSPPATSAERSRVEQAFDEREPLKSCGTLDLQLDRPTSRARGEQKVRCLIDAREARGAELLVVSYTEEGDPVRSYYRVEPGVPGAKVFVDGTDDSFGMMRWYTKQCEGVAWEVGHVLCATE